MSSTPYMLHGDDEPPPCATVLRAAGPLLLAIAGSALVPLPCAFGQMGIPAGTALLLLIAAANDYTTILLVRVATRLQVQSYEEVAHRTMGPRGLLAARVSLVLLLFGTLCGNLAAVQESAARSAELAGWAWLGGTRAGRAVLLGAPTALLILPLSCLSLGEMAGISVGGVAIMLACAGYLAYYATAAGALSRPLPPYALEGSLSATPQALATLGYAFYVQPCALPMLAKLPPGRAGETALRAALHLTFGVTSLVYLVVGAAGLLLFGPDTPQDVLQGFGGPAGAALSGLFALYLMLCFAPICVPLRETLVRLGRARKPPRSPPAARRAPLLAAAALAPAALGSAAGGGGEADEDEEDGALPPLQTAGATAAIVGAALAVALLLPDASATLFALTGATGVCLVAYVLPIAAHAALRAAPPPPHAATTVAAATAGAAAARRAPPRALEAALLERAWQGLVLLLGVGVSVLTLASISRQPPTCVAPLAPPASPAHPE